MMIRNLTLGAITAVLVVLGIALGFDGPKVSREIMGVSPSAQPTSTGCSNTLATIQCANVVTATDGTLTWTYPNAYPGGTIPTIEALAQATAGSTNVINIQMDGVPTNTQAKFRVTVTQQSVVSLIGLTILSVQATPGATPIHVVAMSPS